MISKFLSLNPDEKLLFKSNSTSGIARLYNQANIQLSDSSYWHKFLTIFDSPSDVFSIFSLSDINNTLANHPENIHTLVIFLFQSLHELATQDDGFCPIPNQQGQHAKSSSFGAGWMPSLPSSASRIISSDRDKDKDRNQKLKEALNCIRLLTRLIPIILEGQDQQSAASTANSSTNHSLEHSIFWTKGNRSRKEGESKGTSKNQNEVAGGVEQNEDQFVIQDEDEEDESAANTPSEVIKDPLGATSKKTSGGASEDKEEAERPEDQVTSTTLGQDLLSLTIDLLFYSGFTIPWTSEHIDLFNSSPSPSPSKVNPLIWFTGIGSTTSLPVSSNQSKYFMENRIEVLRLLLTLLSKSMYVEPHLQNKVEKQNLILRFLVCDLDRDRVLKLLCSLLNLVGNSTNGTGITDRGNGKEGENGWFGMGALPNLQNPNLGMGMNMNPNVNKDANSHQDFITLSLQILNVLLYFDPLPLPLDEAPEKTSTTSASLPIPSSAPSFSRSNSNQSQISNSSTSQNPTNLFKYYLSKLHLLKDFSFVFDALISILNQPFNSSTISSLLTSLPAISSNHNPSNPHLPNSSEALLLLWKLITCNKKFRSFVVESKERSQILLGQLLNYSLYSKDSIQLSGLTRLCVFILQDLSSAQSFSENISSPNSIIETKKNISPRNLRLLGNDGSNTSNVASDLTIQVVYSLIATTKSSLISLYIPLVLIITNTSRNFKKLSIKSSNRLLSLFKSFSHPNFLLSDEMNPRILFYLLEAFNNIIRSNPKENLNFIYAVLKNKDGFQKLEKFNLRNGLGEIRRLRGFKNQSLVLNGSGRSETLNSTPDQASSGTSGTVSAEEEKAALAKKDQEELERLERESNAQKQVESEDSNGIDPLSSSNQNQTDEELASSLQKEEISEKTRGKMRKISITGLSNDEINQISSSPSSRNQNLNSSENDTNDALIQDLNEDELYEAARTIGRNGFVATEPWVNRWQKELPLSTIQTLLKSLVQKVEDFSTSDSVANKINADDRVLAFLRELNWDEIFKDDPSFNSNAQIRNFIHNQQSKIWVLSYLWGLIFTSNLYPWASSATRTQDCSFSSLRRITVQESEVVDWLASLLARFGKV